MWFFPGTLILLIVLAINFVGDGLRDALDPQSLAGGQEVVPNVVHQLLNRH